MARQNLLHFYPERIMWIGLGLIAAILLFAAPLILKVRSSRIAYAVFQQKKTAVQPVSYEFSLALKEGPPALPIPNLQKEIVFSSDPSRPGAREEKGSFLIMLKKSVESKRVYLPCRIDLECRSGSLRFSEVESPLWMDLALRDEKIECQLNIYADGEKIYTDQFLMPVQEPPIRSASEFAQTSPFRCLAEGRFLHKDLLFENLEERIELNSGLLGLQKGDWLIFKDGKWEKGDFQEKGPIARIEAATLKGLLLQGWGEEGFVRLLLQEGKSPFKIKAEDLFNSIRIRSEKQISCMLEKQCMILKLSDWAIKMEGKWKILRKKIEKEAFLKAKTAHELFILDEILQKPGQKMIRGRLFSPDRDQMLPVEVVAQDRKIKERKGKP